MLLSNLFNCQYCVPPQTGVLSCRLLIQDLVTLFYI